MTPTETLRAMLDERGVDWDYGITGATTTRFSVNGIDLTFTPMRDGLVCSTILTPEQAIAATLGASDATDARQGDADLAAENAKLRELLDYITPIAWYASSERERDRMRELGVEVDG